MAIPVMRYKRFKKIGDERSEELYYLKLTPGHRKTYNIADLADEIETTGAMSAEDVEHVLKAVKRSMRTVLTRGDKIKIDGLGSFYLTFACTGTQEEKECTVKKIKRVNIRFAVDNTLRLVNASNASTRGSKNNVEFYIKGETAPATSGGNGGGNGGGSGNEGGNGEGGNGEGGGNDDENWGDPSA